MPETNGRQPWLLRAAGIAAAVVVFIGSTLGLWFTMEGRMKEAMNANTQQLTLQIQRAATDLAELHRDDLAVRLIIKKSAITQLELRNEPVPERLVIERDSITDLLREMDRKWNVH